MQGSVYIAVTVDGFIATPDGGVDFLNNLPPLPENDIDNDNDNDMGFADFLASVDVIIMGRKSFAKVLSFGADAWAYGTTPVVVWTRRRQQPPDEQIPEFCRDTVSWSQLPPTALMQQLYAKGHRRAYIDGGTTIQHFLREHLIQELILTRVPILLGDGISLFGINKQQQLGDGENVNLRHVETKSYANGLVKTHYRVEGPVAAATTTTTTNQDEEKVG